MGKPPSCTRGTKLLSAALLVCSALGRVLKSGYADSPGLQDGASLKPTIAQAGVCVCEMKEGVPGTQSMTLNSAPETLL